MATYPSPDPWRPEPRRGDWIQARGPRSKVKLKFYTAPFSHMRLSERGDATPIGTQVPGSVSPNGYVGPVHDVDHSDMFTSVQVPHPDDKHLLVWMNIWTITARGSVLFAHVVTDTELANWFRQGFQHVFI